MKKLFFTLSIFTFLMGLILPAAAVDIPSEVMLFRNVNIFDGKNEKLLMGYDVLVVKNLIKKIGKDIKIADTYEIDVKTGGYKEVPAANTLDLLANSEKAVVVYEPEKMIKKEVKVNVIDGQGRTLMPGLTDAHWHVMHAHIASMQIFVNDIGYLTLAGAESAEATLMRGFTTVRDAGGPVFGIKKMIDEGRYLGPRIYPSGAYITQTSGHGDFRFPTAMPRKDGRELLDGELMAWTAVADGVPQVLRRVRENLMRGASQIKVMAGGGVASLSDPLDVRQYTLEEMKAAVDAAATWNTYVMVHAYSDVAVRGALEAGVQSIEHGQMITEDTAKLIKKKGAWLSLQPLLNDEDRVPFPEDSFENQKFLAMTAGTEKAYALAKKYKLKVAFGTDLQNGAKIAATQGKALTKLTRWYEPWEVLKMATSTNYELFKMSGPRDPYPGENGVIKEGALADLLLVDGNPLENLDLVADPEKNFVIIMKDGKIYKNTLN